MAFTVKIDGLEKLSKVFRQLPKVMQREINGELRAIGEEWTGQARADVPVDRARLKNSISFKTTDLTLEVVAQNEYAPYMEFGTKSNVKPNPTLAGYEGQFKGSSPSGVDPIVALTAWVKRKGLNAVTYNVKTRKKTYRNKSVAAKSIAIAIFKTIKKEGVKAHPFLFTSKEGHDRVAQYVQKLKDNIVGVLKQFV